MTNWPNIQEYRNFEAKFFDNSIVCDDTNVSVTCGEIDSVRTKKLNDFNDWKTECGDKIGAIGGEKPSNQVESRTVRCVITKDFEEAFKKLDRGDGLAVNHHPECNYSNLQEIPATIASSCTGGVHGSAAATDRRSVADQIRLENHLKWKKQKEEEYQRKKLADKKAEELHKEKEKMMEKLKKQKEKEREEKLREWQEQKAKEKEGRKREKLVLKVLEGLKEATPAIDKEKLIEDWVKLKDKQKQIEAEKKAELLKREEESRALRQSLAALSYKQWKEKVKGKNTSLPKNGYQIFAPKPAAVVKEDWNHNFTSNSSKQRMMGLFNTKSTTATNIISQPSFRDLENSSRDFVHTGEIKNRSPSFYHLRNIQKASDIPGNAGTGTSLPLKELQPEIALKNMKSWLASQCAYDYTGVEKATEGVYGLDDSTMQSLFLPLNLEDQNLSDYVSPISKNVIQQPVKKKLELYINPLLNDEDDCFHKKLTKKPSLPINLKNKEIKKGSENHVAEVEDSKSKIRLKKSFMLASKKPEPMRAFSEAHINRRREDTSKNICQKKTRPPEPCQKSKEHRRSKSYDKSAAVKSLKENTKGNTCSASKSMVKLVADRKPPETEGKSRSPAISSKRKIRKPLRPNTPEALGKKRMGNRSRSRANENNQNVPAKINSTTTANNALQEPKKKPKKKVTKQPFPLSDSPYCVKKTSSRNLEKSKQHLNKRKTGNREGEDKRCDGASKKSTSKIS